MGGVNPYIKPAEVKKPTRKYTVTFLPEGKTFTVDPSVVRYGHNGLELSILDISEGAGVDIDHSCGGVCACSTCHCIVREGLQSVSEMSETEDEELSFAPGLTPNSRLSCQSVPDGTRNLVVEIPNWNRNLVREGH